MTKHFPRYFSILSLVLAILFLAARSEAQTFLVDTGAGTNSQAIILCAPCSPTDQFQNIAGQFTLAQSAAISSVQGWFAGTSGQGRGGKLALIVRVDRNGLPGTAIWSQTYTLPSIANSPGQWVPFAGYNVILAPGTYWLSFEPVVGSGLSYIFPTGAPNPLGNYAAYNSLNTGVTWVSSQQDPPNPAYGIRIVGATFPGIAFGTAARTILQGSVFGLPFTTQDAITGDVGHPGTLQWNIVGPAGASSADGAILANPAANGNFLTAGAYSGTGSTASGGARGVAFATYVNNTGKSQNVQVNAILEGSLFFASGESARVHAAANVYVFDTTQFSNVINNAMNNFGQTAGQFLLGGSALTAGSGADSLPNLAALFPPSALLDTSGPIPVEFLPNGAVSLSIATNDGFTIPNGGTFTLLFDVSAASSGAGSAGQVGQGIADFLSTLKPDVNLFTDFSTGLPISGIAGPAAVVLPPAPVSIVLSPASSTNPIGSAANFTATVTTTGGAVLPNSFVRFTITSGPHAGYSAPVGTDSNGVATLPYTDILGTPGTDTIQASIGTLQSNTAQITWTSPGALDHLTLSPASASIAAGGSQPYTATGFDAFNNSLGDVTSAATFTIAPDGSCLGAICTATVAGLHTVTSTDSTKTAQAALTVTASQTTPVITWPTPAPITFGIALSATQLNATANTPGTFAYTPVAGTVPLAGSQTLALTFTPTDTTNFTTASAQVTLIVNKAAPVITWPTPAAVTFGTALSATQLNATANVAGTFVYSPAAGAIPGAGSQTLSVSFTPTDAVDYAPASAQVTLVVNQGTPVITWPTPAAISFGTALSAAQLNATANVAGTFAYTPAAGAIPGAGSQTLSVSFTPTDTADYAPATAQVTLVVNKATPAITWAAPASITFGTPLSATQLNATANVPGTFVYTPATGTVLGAGSQTLSVSFTPTDAVDYAPASTQVTLVVNKAAPVITWTNPPAITFGSALSATQLNATANVAGIFAYTPAAGAIPGAGSQTLSVSFTPTDAVDYAPASAQVTLVVNKAAPVITWATPAAITFGTALSAAQLNATASVPGTFVYTPPSGTILGAGLQTLSVSFSPTDAADYTSASGSASLLVNKATPTITWATPAPITFGTALTAAQLNATASVPGTFLYSPAAGTVPAVGNDTLSVTFSPTDAADYKTASASVVLLVTGAGKTNPVITWPVPGPITYGTPLSSTQLNATANVAGTFAYSPAAGAILTAGSQALTLTFSPTNTSAYNTVTATVVLLVNQAKPAVLWLPVPIVYGTPLGPLQLDAFAFAPGTLNRLAGTFVYNPPAGTVLAAGDQKLSAVFTPADSVDYQAVNVQATLEVFKATPKVTWLHPASIVAGTPLSSTQLNATANVPGAFVYTPAAGTILRSGTYDLRLTFTPTDTANYQSVKAEVDLTVKSR